MNPPVPLPEPPVPEKPRKGKKKAKPNSYSSDPNVRMQQLLEQSEDLRQIGEEWRRFWFDHPPFHPERIHGGIK